MDALRRHPGAPVPDLEPPTSADPGAASAKRSPQRRTQAERRQQAETRLLDAALRIVALRGSERMTMAEVGEAAGYSRGLPAQRFGNKAGLLRALAVHIRELFDRHRLAQPDVAPGLETIRHLVRAYFNRADGDWTTTRALIVMMTESFMEDAQIRADIATYNRSAQAFVANHIAIGIEAGEIAPSVSPTASAILLLGTMRGVLLQWLVDERIDLQPVQERLLAIVDRILTADIQ